MSTDCGSSFGEGVQNITGIMEETFSRPEILVSADGSRVFVVWSHRPDTGDANADAYLRVGNIQDLHLGKSSKEWCNY